MFDLPLFPLTTVLFPGQPLPLHIFEPRYREMIAMCLETRQPFGITLAEMSRPGDPPEWGKMRPYRFACTAEIRSHERLPDGKYNITVFGKDRVRIQRIRQDRAYLMAEVEYYPFAWESPLEVEQGSRVLRHWLDRYLTTLEEAGRLQPGARQMPERADLLAYLAVMLVPNLSMPDKQDLFELATLDALIERLRSVYRREVPLLEVLNRPPHNEFVGPFSLS